MKGWLLWAVSHGVPSAFVTLGTPKKFCALTGPETTRPDVSRTSHELLTPWSTKLGDAASAMSGGLQPWAKYEQVVAEPCCPMKLEVVPGVELPVPVALLPPVTPVLPWMLAGPLP